MGIIWDFFEPRIEEFEENFFKSLESELKNAVKTVTKEIRDEIVREWFGEYNSSSTEEAAEYEVTMNKSGTGKGKSITATCEHKVEPGSFFPSSSTISAWETRHGTSLGGTDWILHLLMEMGIIGLPPIGVVSGWKNNHFAQRGQNLETATLTGSQWSKWASEVASRIGL